MFILRKLIFPVILIVISMHSIAQDSVLMTELMQRIAAQQIDKDVFFINGIFPSYFSGQPHFNMRKKDNNIFFTALIDHTLATLNLNDLTAKTKYDSIHAKAASVYALFKNKKGRNTYNYWRTDTAYRFPYTWWIHRVKKNTALPDDMDDTVLSLLAQNTDSTTAAAVHMQMQRYIIDKKNNVKAVDKSYRGYAAYSVWYGKNFPVVLDVCVLSNVLYFVQHYNLRWTAADSASLQVITKSVTSGDYIKKPLSIAPNYENTSVIIYHIARLMSSKPIPQLESLKSELLTTALICFAQTKNPLEKVLLCTAIMRLGYVPPTFAIPGIMAIEQNDFSFFIANIPSYFPLPAKNFLTRKGLGIFYCYCPAYNDALLLEYLTLKQSLAEQ